MDNFEALWAYQVEDIKADAIAKSDMYNGDYAFSFDISTTPLMKSLTADVVWTDKGYAVYFAALDNE